MKPKGQKNGVVLRQLVQLGDNPGDCWQWIGGVNKRTGYGKKQFHGRTELAHRWIYQQLFGPIPDGLVINHKCRNRRCVNPHHLEVTDVAGNARDGAATKLKPVEVIEIKKAALNRSWGDGARLAKRFNVTSALIHDIWNGRAWANLQLP